MLRTVIVCAVVVACRGDASHVEPVATAPASSPARVAAATITIAGSVIDEVDQAPVAGVEVVFAGPAREITTTSAGDGSYAVAVAPGSYRAFVRDARVMSVGLAERVRLDNGPRFAAIPDLGLAPRIIATTDLRDVELGVIHGGIIGGRVVDEDGLPVAQALVRARGPALRPALGTNAAETDADGKFELRVPPGRYALDASHPKYAALAQVFEALEVDPGATVTTEPAFVAGCIVRGRVVHADGTPSNDGAVEVSLGDNASFGPAGRVESDGTFRWTSNADGDVSLRAWPWRSPPSNTHRVACRAGARFDDIVLHLPDEHPDLEGVLVDAIGAPVPLAYLDVKPLADTTIGQQERADVGGHWQVYDLAPGRYELTAVAPGRGIVVSTVVAPRDGVRLQLGGTGRIAGTTTELPTGSLEVAFIACTDAIDQANQPIAIPHEPRIVSIVGGRFVIDDVPACHLLGVARWRGQSVPIAATIIAGQTAHVELDVGPPHAKTVHGTVRDGRGRAVPRARVTATFAERELATASTDDDGHYTLRTFSGASLVAGDGDRGGTGLVGHANVAEEQVDLVIDGQ